MTSFQQLIGEASTYAEAARALIDPDAAPFEAALCRLLEGMNAQRLSHSEAAEAALKDAAASFEAQGEAIWFARALTQQGFLWFAHQESGARATEVAERALQILEQCESRHYAAMTAELMGKIATSANKWERAYQLSDASRMVYVEQDMEVLAAQAGLHRANIDFWLDAWPDAEQGYTAMAVTSRRYGAYHHIVTSESNLGLLGGEVWCAADATSTRFSEASATGVLARYRAIHIATQAWAGVARGDQAGIAFADRDMLVTDLAQLHLDADVVVLSACESGTALHHAGEEMIGLVYALLQAGSRALVASQWKMDDTISLQLMRQMYEAQRNRHSGPWALAHMQRAELVAAYSPFHWAPYQWIGRPEV